MPYARIMMVVAVATVVIGIVTAIAAWLVVPGVFCYLGLAEGCLIEPHEDNFSDIDSGWADSNREAQEDSSDFFGYWNGGYNIRPRPGKGFVSPLHEFGRRKDVSIEVDANKVGSTDDKPGKWGVVCRQNNLNFYLMGITSTGKGFIHQSIDGDPYELRPEVLLGDIADVSETVRIKGVCMGSRIELYVEDEFVLSAEDEDFSIGYVGLFAEDASGEALSAEVHFDDFEVRSRPSK